MRILAIETSGSAGSVAALDGGLPLAQLDLDPQLRSARTLAPGLQQVLREVGWAPAEVQLLAIGLGPGSFTGLRLGVMTAKAFAYATGAAILGIGTLDAIAWRAPAEAGTIAVGIDAQRGEVYCGSFTREPAGATAAAGARDVVAAGPVDIVAAARWIDSLPAGCVVTGPALAKLAESLPAGLPPAPRESWQPTAAAVGQLAALRAARGARDDVWKLAPLYLRRSAAEEKWQSPAK